MWRQFELAAGDSRLVCWLRDDERLQVGARVTLQELPETLWTITTRYRGPCMTSPPRQVWRVGGL